MIISWNWGLISMIWISVTLGFLPDDFAILSGVVGVEINEYLQTFIGKTGLIIALIFLFISYLIVRYKVTGTTGSSQFHAALSGGNRFPFGKNSHL